MLDLGNVQGMFGIYIVISCELPAKLSLWSHEVAYGF